MIGLGNIIQLAGNGGGGGDFASITGLPTSNAALNPYLSSITNLENNEFKYLYWASVSASSGTVSIPTGATVLLGEIQGLNALVETISGGKPTGNSPVTSGGSPVIISSFDTSGNYVLSGAPSAYPVAVLFVLKVKGKYISNLTQSQIIAEEVNTLTNTNFATFVNSTTDKTIPVDADIVPIVDVSTGKRFRLSNLWTNWLVNKIQTAALTISIPWERKGVSDNSSAASGYIGEVLRASGSGVAIINGVVTSVGSILLGAGHYRVEGFLSFTFGVGTTGNGAAICVSETAGVTALEATCIIRIPYASSIQVPHILTSGGLVVRKSGSSYVHCNAYVEYAGTCTATWLLVATRIR